MMVARPEMDAHSLEEFRKEMLMCASVARSWVFPECVLVWKRRSMPPFSYRHRQQTPYLFELGTWKSGWADEEPCRRENRFSIPSMKVDIRIYMALRHHNILLPASYNNRNPTYRSSNSHTPANQHPRLRIPRRHHAELIGLCKLD